MPFPATPQAGFARCTLGVRAGRGPAANVWPKQPAAPSAGRGRTTNTAPSNPTSSRPHSCPILSSPFPTRPSLFRPPDIGVAANKLNIRNQGPPASPLISQPPHDRVIGNASMYHYTWGTLYKVGWQQSCKERTTNELTSEPQ
jgi:hypothetical protein